MANFKNSPIREMVIDRCLSDKTRKYGTKDIMDACNEALREKGEPIVTSLNTIRYDMREISKRWEAQGGFIVEEKEGRNKYYHYENENFSIFHADLNEEELEKLNAALEVLNRFKGQPEYSWIQEMNARVKASFMASQDAGAFIHFNDNVFSEGKHHLAVLFDAIANRQVVEIDYLAPYDNNTNTLTLNPCHLKEYNSRWYLLTWDACSQNMKLLALDRIQEVRTAEAEYQLPEGLDCNRYFEEMIGVTLIPENPLQKMRLWVAPDVVAEVTNQPFHSSQIVAEAREDGSQVIEIEVRENEEFYRKVLAYGEKVVVLSPDAIRKNIQGRIWVMGERYANF